jgi:Flp pilus assembly protein TadG
MLLHHLVREILRGATQAPLSARSKTRGLLIDRCAGIALATGISAPALVMTVGMAVEVGRWTVTKGELQRAADQAAIAGANQYYAGLVAQTAANAAASVAELNGGSGGASRSWNGTTQTLTDNLITVVVGPGLRNASNIGIQVTVARSVPLVLTQLLGADLNLTISASAWSELSKAQPCILALSQSSSGVTTQGNPNLSMTGCTVRSNSTISTGGSATMTAASFWARTTITGSGYTGTQHPNSGIVPDPYASDSAIKTALAQLSPGSGSSFSNKPNTTNSLTTGTYSGWDVKGRLNLNAGIYYVNGNISLGSQAILSGSGVTIVASGALYMSGGATINLSAATTANDTNGAIPGIVLAGNSTASSSFGGNTGSTISGVVYYPNGPLSFYGTPQAGSTGCLEVIASSISLGGNSSLASNCGGYGALTFGDAGPLGLVK